MIYQILKPVHIKSQVIKIIDNKPQYVEYLRVGFVYHSHIDDLILAKYIANQIKGIVVNNKSLVV